MPRIEESKSGIAFLRGKGGLSIIRISYLDGLLLEAARPTRAVTSRPLSQDYSSFADCLPLGLLRPARACCLRGSADSRIGDGRLPSLWSGKLLQKSRY